MKQEGGRRITFIGEVSEKLNVLDNTVILLIASTEEGNIWWETKTPFFKYERISHPKKDFFKNNILQFHEYHHKFYYDLSCRMLRLEYGHSPKDILFHEVYYKFVEIGKEIVNMRINTVQYVFNKPYRGISITI